MSRSQCSDTASVRLPVSCGTSAAAEAGEPTEMDTLPGMPVSWGVNMVAPPAVVTDGKVAAAVAVCAVDCGCGCDCVCGMVTNCICRPSLDNLIVVVSAVGVTVAGVG